MSPSSDEIKLNQQTHLVVEIKLLQLQRSGLAKLTFDQLIGTVSCMRWKNKQPKMINELVNDILSIDRDEVLNYLRSKAIIDGYALKLSDFEDLIGGKEE